jgi:hypothetical protein
LSVRCVRYCFALEELSIYSAENLSSDRGGRALAVIGHPEGTENHCQTLTHPRRVRKLDPSANRRFAAERHSERIAFSSNAPEQMASRAWEA